MPHKIRGRTTLEMVKAARGLRRKPTTAEENLWAALRGRQVAGMKFRRQHPLGSFVLDLFCVEAQLAVEIDGGVHADPRQAARDAARSEWLAERGIRVLRFRNEEVEQDLAGVLRKIAGPHPPAPSPNRKLRGSGEG
ncbi:MAG: endonuclease domain-containing protein [Chloroflexi bacterium]|nr:endonuclease domain-containing protein [Chloroflexota bacterium]